MDTIFEEAEEDNQQEENHEEETPAQKAARLRKRDAEMKARFHANHPGLADPMEVEHRKKEGKREKVRVCVCV